MPESIPEADAARKGGASSVLLPGLGAWGYRPFAPYLFA